MSVPPFLLVGYASGVAGVKGQCAEGPLTIMQSTYFADCLAQGLPFQWHSTFYPQPPEQDAEDIVCESAERMARTIDDLVKKKERFCVIGGDHTSALGTFSGTAAAIREQGDLGLIWIDAHMDSHTPETTESGRLHGMPLAALLGYGSPKLTGIMYPGAKIKPENVCLIGVRSFETAEALFLKDLNVRVYLMEEVNQRGFLNVLKEARSHVSQRTYGYGISLDLDSIDPADAPAVGVPEPFGLSGEDVYAGFALLASDKHLLATEIAEFDPSHDKNKITERLLVSFLEVLAQAPQ
ncbi:MAG: arginase [Gammaproteobacteria bacterium]|nr:arginase [Gammaproteobacteria bacterium]